jgi:hypothetical protein
VNGGPFLGILVVGLRRRWVVDGAGPVDLHRSLDALI